MRTRNIFLGICIMIVPILFIINILTGAMQEGKRPTTLGYLMKTIEAADIGFTETYISIAEAGANWDNMGEQDDVWAEMGNFFTGLWNTIKIPVVCIGELFTAIYNVIDLYFSLLNEPAT